MNRYPKADKRRYAQTITHRGYSIALWRSPGEPCFTYGDMPIYDLYFVLDELGDNVLPIDLPFMSPCECYAAIDLFCFLDTSSFRTNNPNKNIWSYLQEDRCMARSLGDVSTFFRELLLSIQEFQPDPEFGDDPVDFMKSMEAQIETFLHKIPGWRSVQTMTSID